MADIKTFKVGNEVFEIPDSEVNSFLKDNPEAVGVSSYIVGSDTLDIPDNEVDLFLQDNPDAKPLKKKDQTLSQSTLPSGEEGSVSAIPSTTKIKQSNAQAVKQGNINVIEQRMFDAFNNNSSPTYRKAFIDTLERKGYNRKQLEDISNKFTSLSHVPSGGEPENENPYEVSHVETPKEEHWPDKAVSTIGGFIERQSEMAGYGANKFAEGVGDLSMAMHAYSDKPILEQAGDIGTAALKTAAGGATAGFAVIPQVAAFQASTEAIKHFADKSESTKWIGEAVDLPFTAAHKVADAFGWQPEEESAGANFLELMDLIIGGVALHKGSKAVASTVKGYNEAMKLAADGQLGEVELKELQDFSKELQGVTLDDILDAAVAKGTPQAQKVAEDIAKKEAGEDNDLHEKLAALESDQAKLGEADKGLLQPQIDEIKNEIKTKNETEVLSQTEEAHKQATVSDLNDQISTLEAKKEGLSEEGQAALQKTIDDLVAERDAVELKENLTLEELDEFEILSEAKETGVATKEEISRLKELNAKRGRVTKSDIKESADNSVFPAKEKVAPEPKVEGESIVVEKPKAEITPEKKAFIDKGIKEIKESGEYDEAYQDIYEESLSNKYEILNEKYEPTGLDKGAEVSAITSEAKSADSLSEEAIRARIAEIDTATGRGNSKNSKGAPQEKVKRVRAGNRKPKSQRKLSPRAEAATKVEPRSPYERVLQYLVKNKGNIHPSAIEKLYGNKGEKGVGKEKQSRINILSKKGKTIDQMAHELWETRPEGDERFTDQDYRDFVEEAINGHTSLGTMMDILLEGREKIDGIESEHSKTLSMTPEEAAYYEGLEKAEREFVDEAKDVWNELSEADKEFLAKESLEGVEKFLEDKEVKFAEKAKSLADKIRKGKIDGAMSSIPGLKQAWNGALEVMAKAVEAGGELADAVEAGIEYLKNTEYYKSKTQVGKDLLEKKVRDHAKQFEEAEPPAPVSKPDTKGTGPKREKGVLGNLAKRSELTPEVKKAIENKTLEYEQYSNKDALSVADGIIAEFKEEGENWADRATDFAAVKQEGIPLSINAMVLGKVIAHYGELSKKATEISQKEFYGEKAAEAAERMDELARDFGRFNSAIREVYKFDEFAVRARIKKKLQKANDAKLDKKDKGGVSDREKIAKAYEELQAKADKLEKENAELKKNGVTEPAKTIFTRTRTERLSKIDELKKKWEALNNNKSGPVKQGLPLTDEHVKLIVEIGAEYVALGVTDFAKWTKKIKKELGDVEDSELKKIWENEEVDGMKIKDIASEVEKSKQKVPKTVEEQQIAALNKLFPKKRMESAKKRKKAHEKIVEQFNAGALDHAEFEALFYEKLGLVDPNKPEIKAKMDYFAERIFKAAEGGLKEREYTNMLNFLEDQRKAGMSEWALTPFYANILSGYETHLNNAQFNIMSGIAQYALLAEKNPSHAKFLAMQMLSAFPEAMKKGSNVLMTGLKYGAEAKAESLAERRADKGPGISHYYKLPGRLLSASDVFFNTPVKAMKRAELLLKIADNYNKSLPKEQQKSRKEIEADVNDWMFNTTERKAQALEQAINDVKALEGESVNLNNPKIARDVKLRQFEIMENSRPTDKTFGPGEFEAVKEQAQDFANAATLTNRPVGTAGAISTVLETASQSMPVSRFVITTFVNVPLNLANMMIDKSPLGFLRMASYEVLGRRGLFTTEKAAKERNFKVELTPDQRKEAYIKAANYSAALVGIYALTNMEYTDENGKKRPILEVTSDGTGDYQKNATMKNATGGEYKEYTADFMGFQFSYKYNSILAPVLTPIGAMKDFENYKDKTPETEEELMSRLTYGFFSYTDFVMNQAALQGFRDLFKDQYNRGSVDMDDDIQKKSEKIAKVGGKLLRSLIVPNFALQANKDVKGLMELADKKPVQWYDYAIKDIPFVESIMQNRYDHFGREVKSQFSLPILLVPEKLNIETEDPYYKMALEHKYTPTFVKDKVVFDGENEIDLTPSQMEELNLKRGEFVLRKLQSREKIKDGKTYMEMLDDLNNEDFAEEMNKLYKDGEIAAKKQIVGIDERKASSESRKEYRKTDEYKGKKKLNRLFEQFRRK